MDNRKTTTRLSVIILPLVVLALSIGGCEQKVKGSIPVTEKKKSHYADMAGISMLEALNRAQAKFPGKVIEVELEEENGYLVWEVEIVGEDKTIMDLTIDAGNGAVLKMEEEKEERKEKN